MRSYTAYYFETGSGKRPVEEFIDQLHIRSQQVFFRTCDLLIERGPLLIEPHCKKIDRRNGIYELRFKGAEGNIRVLYFFIQDKKIIFTNCFVKKTSKLPRNELQTAIKRKRIYLERLK